MASPAYEQILRVQSLDLRLRQLRHRLATHPARAEVEEADENLVRLGVGLAEIEGRNHDLERAQKRLNDEVETIEAKRQGIDGKLYGGAVTASKELMVLQDEAASLLDRQRALEDDQLEIMETLEEVSAELEGAASAKSEAEGVRERATSTLSSALATLDGEIAEVEQQRSTSAATANADLFARYEELSSQFDGVAVARFVDGRCDGCHMQLSAIAADQLGKAPEDAVVTCEECGRLLVR